MTSRFTSSARLSSRTRLVVLAGVLLLLPTMAPICETEPNNTPGDAGQIRLYESGHGGISPVADADFWVVENAAAGDLVFAYVDARNSATSTDTYLTVTDSLGATIDGDDSSGAGGSSVVAGAIVPAAGRVYLSGD